MTNSLKCPFCGAELDCVRTLGGRAEYWMCQNTKSCPAEDFVGNKEIWQALIDGKKAQDVLKKARELYNSLAVSYCEITDSFRTSYGRLKTFEQEAEEYMKEYDKEITSITTQEKE